MRITVIFIKRPVQILPPPHQQGPVFTGHIVPLVVGVGVVNESQRGWCGVDRIDLIGNYAKFISLGGTRWWLIVKEMETAKNNTKQLLARPA